MRHLIGIVLAVAMTAAVFFAATWGYARFLAQSSGTSLLSDHRALFALGALAGTGLLAGILIAAPRISPLAAGLPGLLLLGLAVFYLVNVRRADQLIPLRSHVFGAGLETLLTRGVLAAAGLAMIVPLFVPSRWRSRRGDAQVDELGPAGEESSALLGVIPGLGGMPVPSAGAGNPVAPAGVSVQPGPPTVPVYPTPPPYTASPTLAVTPETTQDGLPHRDPPQGIVY
jgi:hypothetical protein